MVWLSRPFGLRQHFEKCPSWGHRPGGIPALHPHLVVASLLIGVNTGRRAIRSIAKGPGCTQFAIATKTITAFKMHFRTNMQRSLHPRGAGHQVGKLPVFFEESAASPPPHALSKAPKTPRTTPIDKARDGGARNNAILNGVSVIGCTLGKSGYRMSANQSVQAYAQLHHLCPGLGLVSPLLARQDYPMAHKGFHECLQAGDASARSLGSGHAGIDWSGR